VIGRIFALCHDGCALRRIGACRVFAESLRRLVGRFCAKSLTLLTYLTRPTFYEFSVRPNKSPTPVVANWKESLTRQRVKSRVF
jgi:hypothetical protein